MFSLPARRRMLGGTLCSVTYSLSIKFQLFLRNFFFFCSFFFFNSWLSCYSPVTSLPCLLLHKLMVGILQYIYLVSLVRTKHKVPRDWKTWERSGKTWLLNVLDWQYILNVIACYGSSSSKPTNQTGRKGLRNGIWRYRET